MLQTGGNTIPGAYSAIIAFSLGVNLLYSPLFFPSEVSSRELFRLTVSSSLTDFMQDCDMPGGGGTDESKSLHLK